MVARKAFHDLGFKMGDGVFAFWKFAHRTEPVVVYSVILGFAGTLFPDPLNPTSCPSRMCVCRSGTMACRGRWGGEGLKAGGDGGVILGTCV